MGREPWAASILIRVDHQNRVICVLKIVIKNSFKKAEPKIPLAPYFSLIFGICNVLKIELTNLVDCLYRF